MQTKRSGGVLAGLRRQRGNSNAPHSTGPRPRSGGRTTALAAAGILCLAAAGSASGQVTRTWTGAASSDWFNAGNWNPSGVPAANDIVNVTTGTVNLSSAVTISNQLNWSGGAIYGKPLTIAPGAVMTLSSGGSPWLGTTLTNAGTVNWTGGTFSLDPYDYGTTAGPVVNAAGAHWNIACDQSFTSRNYLTANTWFLNAGSVQKTTTTGTTGFGIPVTNTGSFASLSGTMSFQAGGLIDAAYNASLGAAVSFAGGSFAAGSAPVCTGPGTIQFTGTSLFLGVNPIANLQLNAGTVTLGAGFQGGTITNLTLSGSTLAGTNTVTGSMTWGAGNIAGPLTVASGGILTLSGTGNMWLGGALTNQGTVNWTGGTFSFDPYDYGNAAGPVVNTAGAHWNIQCDQTLNSRNYLTTNTYFLNAGLLQKLANAATTYFAVPLTNSGSVAVQSGTLNLQDGGLIDGAWAAASGAGVAFAGGSFAAGVAPALSGAGTMQFDGGTLFLPGNLIANLQLNAGTVTLGAGFQGGTITNLTLSGSTLAGTNTVTGSMTWGAGNIAGPLTVASGGVLTLSGTGNMWLGGALTNAGTVNWTGGTFSFDPYDYGNAAGPVVNTAGAHWNIECDQTLNSRNYLTTNTYFLNAGSLQKLANTATTYFAVPLTNSGTVAVQSGTLNLQDGGLIDGAWAAASGAGITFSAGVFSEGLAPALSGAGTIQFTGGTLVLAYNSIPDLSLIGGTVMLGAGFQGGSITNLNLSGAALAGTNLVTGTLTWDSGNISGSLTVATNGQLNLIGTGAMWLLGVLTNAGTVDWTGGNFGLYNYNNSAGPVVNLPGAQWSIQCDQTLGNSYGNPASSYFLNGGTVQKLAGTSTTYFTLPFDNAGIVSATEGTITLSDGGVINGSFSAAGGATINLVAGAFSYTTPPVWSGAGVFEFTGGALTLLNDLVPGLQMTGGTISLSPAFQGGVITNLTLVGGTLAGSNTVAGSFTWNGGTLSGPLWVAGGAVLNWGSGYADGPIVVASNGVLNLAGTGAMWLLGTLTNAGTVHWLGGNFGLYNYNNSAGPVVNLPGAQWSIQCDQTLGNSYGNPASSYFLNEGTVQKLAGAATTYFTLPFDNAGIVSAIEGTITLSDGGVINGSFSAAAGATINLAAGAFSYTTPPGWSGAGAFEFTGGTLTLLNDLIPGLQLTGGTFSLSPAFQGGVITNLTLAGSTLAGSNTVAGTFTWNGGTLSGPLWVAGGAVLNWGSGYADGPIVVASNGVLNLAGTGAMWLLSTLTNAGTVHWIGGNFGLYNYNNSAGPVVNLPGAQWSIQCDQTLGNSYGNPASSYFLNEGTVQKLAGTATTYFTLPFDNAGLVSATEGTITLNDGGLINGSFSAAAGATINLAAAAFSYTTPPVWSGAGVFEFSGGTLTLLNDIIPGLQMTGGTLSLSPAFQGGVITNLTLAGSTLGGSNTVAGVFNWNQGTVSGPLWVAAGGLVNWGSGSASGAINVAANGVFNLVGSSTMAVLGTLTNAGTVNWLGGTLNLYNYNNAAGPIVNQPGALWSIQCDQTLGAAYGLPASSYFLNFGTIQKTGGPNTTYFSVPVDNYSILDIESGNINFNSSPAYTQAGATLEFGISGPGSVAKTTMSGSVSLDGTLQVGLLGGYTPAVGDSVSLLAFGSGSGSFKTLLLPVLPAGDLWQVVYAATGVGLKVVANHTAASQIAGTVLDNHGLPVTNLTVFCYTTNGVPVYLSTATDSQGHYSLSVPDGTWVVGLSGLPALGFNSVSNQIVVVTAAIDTATNLLSNPGAESGTLAGWTVGGTSSPKADNGAFDPGLSPHSGSFDFVGGAGASGSLTQTVPLVGSQGLTAAAIDAGGVVAMISFWEQGVNQGSPSDDVYVNLGFLNVSSNLLGSVATPEIDSHAGSWSNYVAVFPVPTGTRLLQYSMDFVRHDGTDLDAFADDNRLAVSPLTALAVNFTVQPYTGVSYLVTTTANPAGGGTVGGGGAFAPGAMVMVTAQASTNPLPYFFASWTENGVLQSTNASYSFPATRSRSLYANFTLPVFTITATNNPPGAGVVLGTGSYYYGASSLLTAQPAFGYSFINWTEAGVVVGTNGNLATLVYSNRTFGANYAAANLVHSVATATSPPGLATVAGAGSYTNGQTASFSAPSGVTNSPYVYSFQQFTLSNTVVSTNASFGKTFSTLDATNLLYVAVYSTRTLLPLLTNVTANLPSPVPLTTNFQLSLQFDRTMAANVNPVVQLTNSGALVQATVGNNGSWSQSVLPNDTYRTPPITFATGMDGTDEIVVSGAQDLLGLTLAPTNAGSFLVDATPPPVPVLSLVSSNASGPSVVIGWQGYVAPPDLNGFRVYFQATNFNSTVGVPIYTGLAAGTTTYQFNGLSLDTPYYVAVQAFDKAGNAISTVAPLRFVLPSTVPPPVSVLAASVGASSAALSWSGYNTSALFGFAGFRVFSAPTNFTSVAGLVPVATLGPSAGSYQVNGLDRTHPEYFAVVGYNGTNGFNPAVSTARWSDPYAGNIGVNTTIGGTSPSVVNIYQNIVVVSNATLTIQPGTALLFAPGTGLTVEQGTLTALGTALAPIVLDSANDTTNGTPAPGDWAGVLLGPGAGFSTLRFVEIFYGAGLTLNGCTPVVDAFTASFNLPWGLGLSQGATLMTTNALLTFDTIGVRQDDTAALTLWNSVLLNNPTNALAAGIAPLNAISNWWGTTVATNISAKLGGNVAFSPFYGYEPLLTPAAGTVGGVTQVGTSAVGLILACRTADTMRLSEDYNFSGVFFKPFTNLTGFALSPGGGLKRIYAQFKSITGQTNTPVEVDVNYITGGPVIQSFSLSQGQTLHRPVTVTGSATAVLGVADVEFYVDGTLWGTNAGGTLSQYFDDRTLANAVHEVEILARDTAGNVATLQNNVIVAVTPPPAPVIAQPAAGLILATNVATISGTAEPGIGLEITDNGLVLLLTNAAANGSFSLPNALLGEGDNLLLAIASDSTGTTPSAAVHVTVETIPPAQLTLSQPFYIPGNGLSMTWSVPVGGKPSTSYQVFWSTNSFTSVKQTTGNSPVLTSPYYNLQGLADGTYYFAVVGYDAAANVSPLSALAQVVYDATPPVMTVAYTPASPIGVEQVTVVLLANKVLVSTPTLTIQPYGSYSPVLLSLTNAALNTWQTAFKVTATTPTGPVTVNVSAKDGSGNVFTGTPNGPALSFDTTPPAGLITTLPLPPVQTTNSTNVTVKLALTKAAAPGTPPVLTFTPPQGSVVAIALGGASSNWSGTLSLTPAMGSGFGHFALTAQDSVGNVGTNIPQGGQLELYNTGLPPAPLPPTGLAATSLPGGSVRLNWNVSTNAQIYRLYREPGTNPAPLTVLITDGITNLSVVDLPPADGPYTYGVTASRLGSESAMTNVVIGISGRTPPPAPTNVVVALASSGVQITWQEPPGATPDHYLVYRNGSLISSVPTITPVVDFPPQGTNTYIVASADAVGNQNPSAPATLAILVGPVNNLAVVVVPSQPVVLKWTSTDPQTTGFNLYRNGVKQNASLLATNTFTDPLALSDATQYAVTAANGAGQESPPRLVTVFPLKLGLLVDSAGSGANNLVLADYFDQYQAAITNGSTAAAFPLGSVQITRSVAGAGSASTANAATATLPAGTGLTESFTLAEPALLVDQSVSLSIVQQTDSDGSQVVYQQSFAFPAAVLRQTEIVVSANQLPLAGGLSTFQVQVRNPSTMDIEFIVSRGLGAEPGDVYLSVQNNLGQELSRSAYQGGPAGTVFLPDGRGYATVKAGGVLNFPIPNVLVPAALTGATNVIFQAVVSNIYSQFNTSTQVVSGPLTGSMISSGLASPPYVGTAQPDKASYANNPTILIQGQALSTTTSQPVPNVPLNIGFAARGHKWYVPVTTDTNGNYQLSYLPPPGFSGVLTLWAANPAIVDQLDQASVTIYELYSSPASADITSSKNDTLNFQLQLINPGDLPMTAFSYGFRAYTMSGTNEVPVTTVTGTNLTDPAFVLPPNTRQNVNLQLTAAVNAPGSLIVEYTFLSAEGAALTFTGNVTLLPAIPLLSVVDPPPGYLDVSVNRGDQLSGQITIQNTGLQPLQGITISPPTNYPWMQVNLPVSGDGLIHLPDMPIGGSNTIIIVFSPPSTTDLAFDHDVVTIRGTNSATAFNLDLYALVTSDLKGGVQFYVDDILGLPVPNAAVVLHSDVLFTEPPPFYTDTNGLVTITNLQEGAWNWQVSASGCSSAIGTVAITADQTGYQHARLSRSLVTVTFSVVPIPFTDQYTIQVEQTYETHVPAPVIVLDPPYMSFLHVSSPFQASYTVNINNYGLIQLSDVVLTGHANGPLQLTPLITYIPAILPNQTIQVPYTLTYDTSGGGQSGGHVRSLGGQAGRLVSATGTGRGGVPRDGDPVTVESGSGRGVSGGAGSGGTTGTGSSVDGTFYCQEDGDAEQAGGDETASVEDDGDGGDGSGDDGGGSMDVEDNIAGGMGDIDGGTASSDDGDPDEPGSFDDGGSGSSCFAPDTPVLMADGSVKSISEIRIHDRVRSGRQPWNVATVANTLQVDAHQERILRFSAPGSRAKREIIATPEHLIWVDGKGWVSAANVAAGDWFSGPAGERLRVAENVAATLDLPVFTLSLQGDSAFYANGVLVRHLCGRIPPPAPITSFKGGK